MSWFSTKILYKSKNQQRDDHDVLYEESIRIFTADNEHEAQQKAEDIGRMNQHEYLNDNGETIRWNFVQVLDVQDLCEDSLSDGVEVYSYMYFEE